MWANNFRSASRRISIVERSFGIETTDETLESFGEKCNAIIPLLIDLDDRRLAFWAAFAVVETYHVVARRWAIGEVDPDAKPMAARLVWTARRSTTSRRIEAKIGNPRIARPRISKPTGTHGSRNWRKNSGTRLIDRKRSGGSTFRNRTARKCDLGRSRTQTSNHAQSG